MDKTVKQWADENCETTGQNKLICQKGTEQVVIDPYQQQDHSNPATEQNVERFLNREKSIEIY